MQSKHKDVAFYVSTVKKSRLEEHREHYCADVIFKDEADRDKHAVAHAIWIAQQKVRYSKDVAAGLVKKAPKNFQPYKLQPVHKGKLADGQVLKANAVINSDGIIQEDLSQQKAKAEAINMALFQAALEQDPNQAIVDMKAMLARMMETIQKAEETITNQESEESEDTDEENDEENTE